MKRAIYFLLLIPALCLYLWVLYRTAWLSDDSYITYRVVDNFVHGFGLRWNVAERVQVYTHPLWMFLIAAAYAVTREMYLTAVFVSMTTSLFAVAILGQFVARNVFGAWLAVAVFISSRAFVDYSTSGLENPLTHLLLALFLAVYLGTDWSLRSFFGLCLIAALAALNRIDTLALYLPALLWLFVRLRNWKAIPVGVLGFLPLAAWFVFSLVYYGFPFPNTAYAKLGTGIEKSALIQQGFHYFEHTFWTDPVTLPAIALGLLASVAFLSMRHLALGCGITLYCLYILWIGGDFMAGRFFSAPLFLAVCILVSPPAREGEAPVPAKAFVAGLVYPVMFAGALWLGLQSPYPPLKSGPEYGKYDGRLRQVWDENYIADERRFYFQGSGLLNFSKQNPLPGNRFTRRGKAFASTPEQPTRVYGGIGFCGFYSGPKIHIIDFNGLSDPLLARLPAKYTPQWRIGHFVRHLPEGYVTGARLGQCQLHDADLQRYLDQLQIITRGPLFEPERWEAIVAMNLGQYDHLVDWERYRFPGIKRTKAAEVSRYQRPGTHWNADSVLRFGREGVEVAFEDLQRAQEINFSADCSDHYRLLFLKQSKILAETDIPANHLDCPGLVVHEALVPSTAAAQGFDAIRVFGYEGDGRFAIGHLWPGKTLPNALR